MFGTSAHKAKFNTKFLIEVSDISKFYHRPVLPNAVCWAKNIVKLIVYMVRMCVARGQLGR